jgi:hypothetical protein
MRCPAACICLTSGSIMVCEFVNVGIRGVDGIHHLPEAALILFRDSFQE